MHITYTDKTINYTGSELRSQFIYEQTHKKGDGIYAFTGSMDVKEHLVDSEDRIANDFIWSPFALNFIIEIFHINIETSVLYQRLFMQKIVNQLQYLIDLNQVDVETKLDGDDIMVIRNTSLPTLSCKMSVSIATVSHISGLIHAAINLRTDDKIPVPAIGLFDIFNTVINTKQFVEIFAETVMDEFKKEVESIKDATYKIIGV